MSAPLDDQIREYTVQLDAAIDRRVAIAQRPTMLPGRHPERMSRRWMQRGLVAAAAVVAVAVTLVVLDVRRTDDSTVQVVDAPVGSGGSVASPTGGSTVNDPTATDTAVDETAISDTVRGPETTQPQPEETVLATTLDHPLDVGDAGIDVGRLQERLAELFFVSGPADGVFGSQTQQAVWAFKALVMKVPPEQNSSEVTDQVWQVMQQPMTETLFPRRTLGPHTTHVEVYLPEQVLAVFTDDRVTLIAHISSGTGQQWCDTVSYDTDENGSALPAPVERAVCAIATTPPGVFRITRSYVGLRVSPSGGLTNPIYFNYGIAIAGADNVPLAAASHGAVRVNQTVAALLPDLVHIGDRVFVWSDDGREPEDHTKSETIPSFSYPDPSASTQLPVDTAAPGTLTDMPLVTGLVRAVAEELLAEHGLVAETSAQDLPYGSPSDGRVLSQSVPAGTQVQAGSTVSLVVGRASAAATTVPPPQS